MSSRRTCASDRPTGASTSYVSPLTRSSGRCRHRDDVRQVDEPEGCARVRDAVLLVALLRKDAPHVMRGEQQLANLVELGAVAVRAVVASVESQAEDADAV